jgi:ketosteroid isomerase-like protein
MPMTKEDVAEAVRGWCTAWHTQDIQTIVAMEARAVGFGFRPWAWRDHLARSEDDYAQVLTRFFGQIDDYSVQPEDFQTSVTGVIGLVWGVYLEQWQAQGQPPEPARVRFSKVLTKGARGWQVLLYHRDIQPFTDDGRYPRALTVVPQTPEEDVTSRHHFP